MATNVQFSIAVHVMAALATRVGKDTSSVQLASTVNTSPSFVRRVLAKLSKAGLVQTSVGPTGACRLARSPEQVSMLDIYRSVDVPRVFAIHDYPEQRACLISTNIKRAMGNVLAASQRSAEKAMEGISLAEVVEDLKQ